MIKKYGFLTVSLMAIMAVTSARADIASTTYVNNKVDPVETKIDNHIADTTMHVTTAEKTAWNGKVDSAQGASNADKVMITDDSGDVTTTTFVHADGYNAQALDKDTTIPSVEVVENIVLTAAGDYVADTQETTNMAMVTNNDGKVVPGQIATGMIANKAVTNDKLSDAVNTSLGLANSAVQPADITDMETKTHASGTYATQTALGTTNSNVSNLTTRVGTAEGNITSLQSGKLDKKATPITASTANSIVQYDENGLVVSGTPAGSMATENKNNYYTKTEIGTPTAGKTIVQMISDAQTAATYDDTALAGRVTANENAITKLNGDANTAGSVAKSIADAITDMQVKSNLVNDLDANKNATDKYPSAKTVYDAVEAAKTAASGSYQSKLGGTTATAGKVVTATATAGEVEYTQLGSLATKSSVAKTDLASALKTEIEGKANSADLGTAAAKNVSTNGVAANDTGLVTGGQVQTAISNLNLGTTYQAKSDSTVAAKGNYIAAGSDVKGNLVALDTQLKTTDNVAKAAIPAPQGTCTDCVLHFNGTEYTWEEVGR